MIKDKSIFTSLENEQLKIIRFNYEQHLDTTYLDFLYTRDEASKELNFIIHNFDKEIKIIYIHFEEKPEKIADDLLDAIKGFIANDKNYRVRNIFFPNLITTKKVDVGFTPKEMTVYQLYKEDKTYQEIMNELGVDNPKLIDNAIQRVKRKLEKAIMFM